MIAIIDYGLSNLACVKAAVDRLGYNGVIVNKSEKIQTASRIILPGVGAFEDAIDTLHKNGMAEALDKMVISKGIPFLGICLGAQLVCETSDEYGHHSGFGWFNAEVKKITTSDKKFRVPHTGWNELEHKKNDMLFEDIDSEDLFYFTHSYGIYPKSEESILAYCNHGNKFAAVLNRENIYAVQFHPEKSQKKGLQLLDNFIRKN